jgi:hypothetical protein
MKLLSGMDSLFLHVEQGSQHMHVAGLISSTSRTRPVAR